MISQKKLDANRRNALNSTGPKTEAGKAIARMNGLTHGLTAHFVPILPGEDEGAFNELRDALTKDLRPCGPMQKEIADDIVQIRWKLRRLPRVEAQRMARAQERVRNDFEYRARNLGGKLPDKPLEDHPVQILARDSYFDEENARIELYRQRLLRQMHTLLRELRQLRKETGDAESDEDLGLRTEKCQDEQLQD